MKRDWLARYRAGHHRQIWHELRQLGSAVRDPDVLPEAQLVCDEMAVRARQNIEAIVKRLESESFRFHSNDDHQTPVMPHIPPSPNAAEHADWLERQFGPVPLTLLSWVRLVGDVWLVGTHPEWPTSSDADPLVIQLEGAHHPEWPIRDFFTEQRNEWPDRAKERAHEPFILEIAPDRLHKANVSGGSPYGFVLPDASADGLFRAEVGLPFVEYLNSVFRRRGFPFETGGGAKEWEITSRGDALLEL